MYKRKGIAECKFAQNISNKTEMYNGSGRITRCTMGQNVSILQINSKINFQDISKFLVPNKADKNPSSLAEQVFGKKLVVFLQYTSLQVYFT